MAVNIKKEFGNTRSRKPDLSTLVYGKIPPQAPELEEAVLGAMLLEKDKQAEVLEMIPDEEYFYVDAHQKIFAGIRRLMEKGSPIDLLTITEELRSTNELEIAGGAYYLTRLTQGVVSSAHVEAHSRIIIEKFMLRELIRISGMVINNAYDDSTDVFDLLEQMQAEMSAFTQDNITAPASHVGPVYGEMLEDIEHMRTNQSVLLGVDTGLTELNNMTNGWQDTDLIILAARPAQGKTALAVNLAVNAATSAIVEKRGVLIFSLEMSKKQLLQRMASSVTEIPFEGIRRGNISEGELVTMINKTQQVSRMPIWIDDRGGINITQLKAKAKKEKKKHGIGLIIIDYLQLMRGTKGKGGNREQEVAEISRELKALAKELEVPIIALSQLNRESEKQKTPRPNLGQLRESGAIEQDADMVIFIWHEKDGNTGNWKDYITISKHRNGKCDDIELKFLGHIQRWTNKDTWQQFEQQDASYKPFAGIKKEEAAPTSPLAETDEDLPF